MFIWFIHLAKNKLIITDKILAIFYLIAAHSGFIKYTLIKKKKIKLSKLIV